MAFQRFIFTLGSPDYSDIIKSRKVAGGPSARDLRKAGCRICFFKFFLFPERGCLPAAAERIFKMYKSVICHLHSTFEGTASISGYCYEAARHGIDAVWLSDHDTRVPGVTGNHRVDFERFNFSEGAANKLEFENFSEEAQWKIVDVSPGAKWEFREKSRSITLRSFTESPIWQGASMHLHLRRTSDRRPLIGFPRVKLDFDTGVKERDQDARVIIRVYLSQVPPEHEQIFIDYVAGKCLETGYMLPLPLADGPVSLDLAADAKRLGLGLDHTLVDLEVRAESRNKKEADISLKGLEIKNGLADPGRMLETQRRLGEEIGKSYGVEVLCGYEISGSEMHLTCFGDNIPVYPYKDGERPPAETVNEYVERHGGLLSINHVFSPWKNRELTGERKLGIISEKAGELIRRKACGCGLIEVGFPEGRHGFSVEHYLLLWDMLNLGGLCLPGIAVSDAHANRPWEEGNNFANYVASSGCTARELMRGLKKGNFFMADPCRFKGDLFVSTDTGKTMGDTQESGRLRIELKGLRQPARLRCMADGKCLEEQVVSGEFRDAFDLNRARYFARIEIRSLEGRLLLLTNPVWTGPDRPAESPSR